MASTTNKDIDEITLVCGCNGVGKSTLTNSLILDNIVDIPVLDQDKIVKDLGYTQVNTGKLVIKTIDKFINNKISFIRESTLSSNFDLKLLEIAKKNNFLTSVIYIGLKNEQLAISRIGIRYSRGGHNVPDEDVIRRYNLSLKNLPKAIKLADRLKIFDNTSLNYKYIGKFKNGQLETLNSLPLWLESTFCALGLQDKIDNFHTI